MEDSRKLFADVLKLSKEKNEPFYTENGDFRYTIFNQLLRETEIYVDFVRENEKFKDQTENGTY